MQNIGSTRGFLTRLGSAAVLALGLTGAAQAALVGHYTFDGNADDSAGGAPNLTLNGGAAVITPGLVGSGALSVDGTDDYAGASTSNIIGGASAVTLSAWFKASGTSNLTTNMVLVQLPVVGTTTGAQSAAALELASGKISGGGRSTSAEGFQGHALTATTLVGGKTYFAAAVLDYANDMVTTYLYNATDDVWTSGSAAKAFADSTTVGDESVQIGRRGDNARFFNGVIDDVRIYNHGLSETDIQGLIPEPASLALLGFGGLLMQSRPRKLRRA